MTSPSRFPLFRDVFSFRRMPVRHSMRFSLALLTAVPLIGAGLRPLPALADPAAGTDSGAAKTAPINPQSTVSTGTSGAPCKCQGLPDFVQIVHKVKPAVVSISARIKEDDVQEGPSGSAPMGPGNGMGMGGGMGFPFPFMPFPFQSAPQPSNRLIEARGSGFLISPDGYIVTNNHVVKGATRVMVKLDDGTSLPARIVGTDPKTDLALLHVKVSKPLPYVDLGNSDDAQPGQWVVAVGNPFGLGGTVTAGIISAMGRDLHSGAYNDFIQVDAPINQGNSGGPLITLNGKVIGVNSMIMSANGGGSIGIGFAIPSDTVKAVVAQLRKNGHVVRGSMGVEVQDISPVMAQALHLPLAGPGAPPHGALVASVGRGSPAEKAGLKSGDVILALNGHPVLSGHDLAVHVTELAPGTKATVEVLRDGKKQNIEFVTANLSARSPDQNADAADTKPGRVGVSLSSLTPRVRQELGLDENVQGAVVAGVAPDSPAEHAGIRPGDVIVGVGPQATPTPKAVVTLVQKAMSAHQPPLLRILRDGQQLFVAVSPDSNADMGDE
nr:Do family serine endopeptidase [Oecophyllibacter saccharovorans]